jgi:hypothetical protein
MVDHVNRFAKYLLNKALNDNHFLQKDAIIVIIAIMFSKNHDSHKGIKMIITSFNKMRE